MASQSASAVSALERVEAILANPAVYELAELIPPANPAQGGRPRHYPDYMVLIFEALLSVYGSARQVEVELAHPLVWEFIRAKIRARFSKQPDRWLPDQPMRRHHYRYLRNRYLTQPELLRELLARHRGLATDQARTLGLLDPDGPGSWTHPDPSRMLHADGKVITPLFKARPDDSRLDTTTGELRPVRHEADAALHIEGDGNHAWGIKFVLVATRTPAYCATAIGSLRLSSSMMVSAVCLKSCHRPLMPPASTFNCFHAERLESQGFAGSKRWGNTKSPVGFSLR